MDVLLKRIRETTNYSQIAISKELGVSFAKINRWGEHALPNKFTSKILVSDEYQTSDAPYNESRNGNR